MESTDKFAEQIEGIHTKLREHMIFTQSRYKAAANTSQQQSPDYKARDIVFINRHNLSTNQPSKKLDVKNHRPFSIIKKVSSRAYHVKLPNKYHIHNIFHT